MVLPPPGEMRADSRRAVDVLSQPPVTSTRPSSRRVAVCHPRARIPAEGKRANDPLERSYSSIEARGEVLVNPPTTRTRPLPSAVAVWPCRGVVRSAVREKPPSPEQEADQRARVRKRRFLGIRFGMNENPASIAGRLGEILSRSPDPSVTGDDRFPCGP